MTTGPSVSAGAENGEAAARRESPKHDVPPGAVERPVGEAPTERDEHRARRRRV